MSCPSIQILQSDPTGVAWHVERCPACRMVSELLWHRDDGLTRRARRAGCARLELALAARDDGDPNGKELIVQHVASCDDCRAIVDARKDPTPIPAPVVESEQSSTAVLDEYFARLQVGFVQRGRAWQIAAAAALVAGTLGFTLGAVLL
jgi:hypothetical protein